jgi:integrase
MVLMGADMAVVGLNEATIKALPIPAHGNQVHWFPVAKVEGKEVPRGFGVVVTAGGVKSFALNYRIGQRQRRFTIGRWPEWTVVAAVREARLLRQRIDRGDDPLAAREKVREAARPQPEPEPVKTVAAVLDDFLANHVDKKLRDARHYRYALLELVMPAIGKLPIYGLRRSQIATMLDGIEAQNGVVTADRSLAYLSSAFTWYAARDDDFSPPRLKGLKRATRLSRDRVLTDDEIRAVWRASEANGTFGAVVRFLLLTGQRRGDVYGMEWRELEDNGTWTIPATRYKTGRAHSIPLSGAALAIVEGQPRSGQFVFPGVKGGQLSSGGDYKATLDAKITMANDGMALDPWTLHDLRRTARTLMARAGVRPDVAERVVGHVIRGVEGIYDRHTYEDQKRAALEALSRLIADILDPMPANVVPLRQEA